MTKSAFFLLIALSASTLQHAQTLAATEYRIGGTIVDSVSGTPLSQARVFLQDVKSRQAPQSVVTQEGGRFEFTGLGAGKYSLQAAKRGYVAIAYNQHDQFSTAIVTGAGVDTEHLMFRLPPTAAIVGKILDEAGEPVREAQVTLYREGHSTGMTRITHFRAAATDDIGTYEFVSLPAGNYFVGVQATPWYAIHPHANASETPETSSPTVDGSLDVAYPPTYYAGATESDDATPILVRNGDRVEIDIHLAPVPALRVIMRSAPGADYRAPIFQRRVFDSTEPVQAGGGSMDPSGTFVVWGIPAGHYVAQVRGPHSVEQLGEVDVTRDGQSLDVAASEPLGVAHFTVQVAGQDKLPQQLALGLMDTQHHPVAFQLVDAQGQANFDGLVPGKYSLLAPSASKLYSVMKITVGGTPLEGNTLNISSGERLEAAVSLASGSANVEGVAQKRGKPLAGAMIVLVPANAASNYQFFRRDQSDLDGSFNLRDVVPGAYTAIAIEDGWDLDWSSPGAIAHYATRGQEVIVHDGTCSAVTLSAPLEAQSK